MRDTVPLTTYLIGTDVLMAYRLSCCDQTCTIFGRVHRSCWMICCPVVKSWVQMCELLQMIQLSGNYNLDLFYCMKTILKPIQKLKESYERVLISKQPVHAKSLNIALLSNPFIKDQQHYKAIKHQLNLYNKRVLDRFLSDEYQVSSHQKLFSIVSDLANLQTPQDMVNRLQVTWTWWVQQKRKIKQRKDLGLVKYKTDRQTDKLKDFMQKMNHSDVIPEPNNLPNEKRYVEVFPFQMHYRTAHKEMDIPTRRLSQYKRKLININDTHFLEDEDLKKKRQKVLYPRPKKYVPPETNQDQNNPEMAPPGQNPQPISPQNMQAANNAIPQIPPADDPNKPPQVQDPNQQDLGMGLGQEPGQPEQEEAEQAPQEDKLAPRNKIYTWSNLEREEYGNQKTYQRPYMYYRGRDSLQERRMEERAVLKQQYSLQIQREEVGMITKAHEWAAEKEKVAKQRQLILQNKINRPSYSFSYQDPETKEMLSVADQKKYGFYVPAKINNRSQIVLDDKLPVIGQFKSYEKQIRRDRLNSLKHKFAGILNIKENSQNHSNSVTMCQVSPRRRDLSMILNQHSPQKERDLELEQIQKIKQNLRKNHINVNIRTLAQALVLDTADYKQQQFSSPSKQLPNNPFFVEVKKKKKK